ncbi:hypothetical protein AUJ29_00435 [Candidatus Kuenenbacteria bacterium CG1_02_38_13]|uniref:Uncharacterized protein n=1 Tax=Candidatus Kuenenbacteria bacterium CG1_02_38_13 TaxID=1805235 RepID=A0A1J4U5T3_9BACT|nr:MAG: hypothetical protein AUJ29_00435 [Candidatus Kuenenbacteria bacterium CG1_02_38_13]
MFHNSKQIAKTLIKLASDYKDKEILIIENFIKFAERKNILHQLPRIVKYLELENKKRSAAERLTVSSQKKLSASLIKNIKEYVRVTPETELDEIPDENIKGGFIARHKNMIYDASIKTQLAKLKNNLII